MSPKLVWVQKSYYRRSKDGRWTITSPSHLGRPYEHRLFDEVAQRLIGTFSTLAAAKAKAQSLSAPKELR